MPHLRLSLLGGLKAYLDDQPLTGFASDKVRSLLIYLVLEADRAHSRPQLAGLLWPDWSESQARTYLLHALANLRQLLHDKEAAHPFLLVTRHTLQFNLASHHTVDALTLAAYLSTQNESFDRRRVSHLADALISYQSPLLAGFYLDGCPEFEAWLLLVRERLQRQVLDALQGLASYHESEGTYQQAINFMQKAVELEPWREEAHRHLMQLFAHSGQRIAALAQYERCVRLLRDELGVEPSNETVMLYQTILNGVETVAVQDKPELERITKGKRQITIGESGAFIEEPLHNLLAQLTPLLGRKQELAVVLRLFQVEGARLVTLTGPGGVGKTRLALEAVQKLLGDFADGTYWVALASIREPALVTSAIAEVIGIREAGSRSLLERLQAVLRQKQMLLLIDNLLKVIDAAPVVTALLTACPQLRVLVISRERLSLQGEYEYVNAAVACADPRGCCHVGHPGSLSGDSTLLPARPCSAP